MTLVFNSLTQIRNTFTHIHVTNKIIRTYHIGMHLKDYNYREHLKILHHLVKKGNLGRVVITVVSFLL